MKKIVASTTATSEKVQREHEFEEVVKIINLSYTHLSQAWLMKKVYEKYSSNGHLGGVMSVYELGRVAGIREERERSERGSAHETVAQSQRFDGSLRAYYSTGV